MKITKVITAFNMVDTYMSFVGVTTEAWKTLTNMQPVVGYVCSNNHDADRHIIDHFDPKIDLEVFPRIPRMDYGIQAKLTRLYIAQSHTDDYNMIADVDMIPLHKDTLRFADNVPDDHLIQFGYDHPAFQRNPDIGKWPMDKTTAKGSTFKEIVNPKDLPYEQLLTSWTGFGEDVRSNAFNTFTSFSDESLLKCLHQRWSGCNTRTTKVRRDEMPIECPQETLYGRLYKHAYPTLQNIDVSQFFEAHGPRPFNEWYLPIQTYLESYNDV